MEWRLNVLAQAREEAAALIGAHPQEISLQENTTAGRNAVIWGLRLRPGDEVCTTDLEHPSLAVPLLYARRRRRVRLRPVHIDPSDDGERILEAFRRAVGLRTRLVAISHVAYGTGQLLPLPQIAEEAHRRGALVLVDAAQSVGQMPVNVREMGCDFLAFPGHKWLLGPAGTGVLYIRRELVPHLEPPWVAHRAAHRYALPHRLQPASDDIAKFELTTRSVPLWAGFLAALGFARSLGLEEVATHVRSLARHAARGLAAVPGVSLVGPQEPQTGLLSFRLAGVEAEVVTALLWQWGRVVARTVPSLRATRLSLHCFNTPQEVEQVVEVVRRIATAQPPGALPQVRVERMAMQQL
jgi:selenocysteine lyase/cysteine desulfurase